MHCGEEVLKQMTKHR